MLRTGIVMHGHLKRQSSGMRASSRRSTPLSDFPRAVRSRLRTGILPKKSGNCSTVHGEMSFASYSPSKAIPCMCSTSGMEHNSIYIKNETLSTIALDGAFTNEPPYPSARRAPPGRKSYLAPELLGGELCAFCQCLELGPGNFGMA